MQSLKELKHFKFHNSKNNSSVHIIQPERWVTRYGLYLTNYAKNRVPLNLVQDLVQETFYHGLKSAKNFEGNAHERTWLVSILRFKIVDYYRKSNSKKGLVHEKLILESDYNERHTAQLNNLIIEESGIESSYSSKELKKLLDQAMTTLTKSEHQVFVLSFEGYKTQEICEVLQIKRDSCWVFMSKARKKIRIFIEKN